MLQLSLASPVATADTYYAMQGTTLTVGSASSVLANDRDINLGRPGVQLAAVLADGPEHGQLTLNADGSFAYSPDPLFDGLDTFRYRAFDGFAESVNISTVTIQVASPTDPPWLRWLANQGQLQLSWPSLGAMILQAQTNSPGQGLGINWITIPDSNSTNQMTIPICVTNGSVFFRLAYP